MDFSLVKNKNRTNIGFHIKVKLRGYKFLTQQLEKYKKCTQDCTFNNL